MISLKWLASLLFCSIPFIEFPVLKDDFHRRGIWFKYESRAYMEDGRYFVHNKIATDSKREIVLDWPAGKIYCLNDKPHKIFSEFTYQVSYPKDVSVSSIFLGANRGEEVENIKCWVDEEILKEAVNKYSASFWSHNEYGESASLAINSTQYPELNSAITELKVNGKADLLVKYDPSVKPDSAMSKNFSILSPAEIAALFKENKNGNDLREFLDRDDTTSTYYLVRNLSAGRPMNVRFTSQSRLHGLRETPFCLIARDRSQVVGFYAKTFTPQ